MKYYISDLHLFHENAIKFDHRPFESVQEMHEVILKNWNDRVTNGDFVYLLGVCCRGFDSHQNFKSSVAQLVEHRFNPIISPKGCRQLLLLTSN